MKRQSATHELQTRRAHQTIDTKARFMIAVTAIKHHDAIAARDRVNIHHFIADRAIAAACKSEPRK